VNPDITAFSVEETENNHLIIAG